MVTNAPSPSIVPMMGVEGGFLVDETVAPFRITGFLSLIFGLLSILTLIAYVMVIVPLIAIGFGLIALRPWSEPRPVGLTLAKVGMVLAVAFGSCGVWVHSMRSRTLAEQAVYFGKQYLYLLGSGEIEIANELSKDYRNRLPVEVPIKLHYATEVGSARMGEEFRDSSVHQDVMQVGPSDEWELTKKPRVFHRYGYYFVEMVFTNPKLRNSKPIVVQLRYELDNQGNAQWNVDHCRHNLELLVAERVT